MTAPLRYCAALARSATPRRRLPAGPGAPGSDTL